MPDKVALTGDISLVTGNVRTLGLDDAEDGDTGSRTLVQRDGVMTVAVSGASTAGERLENFNFFSRFFQQFVPIRFAKYNFGRLTFDPLFYPSVKTYLFRSPLELVVIWFDCNLSF